jgi:hypothetical protein
MSKYNKKINIQSNESEEETKKSIKSSNVEKMNSSDSNEETPARRKEYDNIKKQTEVFNKLKILIKINEENRFNSFDVNASKEKLLNNLYFEIKEYFPPTIWYFRSNAKYQEMSLIRKMFKFFNFHITYNTTTRKINGEKVKGVNYLVTKKSTNI